LMQSGEHSSSITLRSPPITPSWIKRRTTLLFSSIDTGRSVRHRYDLVTEGARIRFEG